MKVYIIASAKMEELYVRDWIDYHLSLGVDKIIINDNNNEDYPYKLKDVIKEYIDSGKVIVENYYKPHNEINLIYSSLYNKYKNEFDWCAKLDIDEYLEIPETNNDIKKFLSLDKFKNYDVIMLPWIIWKINDNYNTYYLPINVKERCNKISAEGYQYFFKCMIRSLDNDIEMSHHIPFIDSKKMCISNGIGVQEAINKKICCFNKTKATLFTDCYKALKFIKYTHLNHYRNLSVEEDYYKNIKIHNCEDKSLKEEHLYLFKEPRNLYKIYLESKCN